MGRKRRTSRECREGGPSSSWAQWPEAAAGGSGWRTQIKDGEARRTAEVGDGERWEKRMRRGDEEEEVSRRRTPQLEGEVAGGRCVGVWLEDAGQGKWR